MTSSLKEFWGRKQVDWKVISESGFAHCIIDVQKEFCDPKESRGSAETEKVATRIANVAPLFRQAMIPTFVVYFSFDKETPISKAMGGLFKLKMESGDVPVAKDDNSAFKGSDIKELLKWSKVNTLLVSGFNLNACVRQTVIDALSEGFNVWVLEDCVGNDSFNEKSQAERYITMMKEAGAQFKNHKFALDEVRSVNSSNANLGANTI